VMTKSYTASIMSKRLSPVSAVHVLSRYNGLNCGGSNVPHRCWNCGVLDPQLRHLAATYSYWTGGRCGYYSCCGERNQFGRKAVSGGHIGAGLLFPELKLAPSVVAAKLRLRL
jgi:hypothetical protein